MRIWGKRPTTNGNDESLKEGARDDKGDYALEFKCDNQIIL